MGKKYVTPNGVLRGGGGFDLPRVKTRGYKHATPNGVEKESFEQKCSEFFYVHT